MNAVDTEEQVKLANLIDLAVVIWHEVAEEHNIRHCNCFREAFASRLIKDGTFVGYVALGKLLSVESREANGDESRT